MQVKRCVILAILPPRQLACFHQGSWQDFTTAVGAPLTLRGLVHVASLNVFSCISKVSPCRFAQCPNKYFSKILKKVLTNVLTYVIIYSNSGILLKFSHKNKLKNISKFLLDFVPIVVYTIGNDSKAIALKEIFYGLFYETITF